MHPRVGEGGFETKASCVGLIEIVEREGDRKEEGVREEVVKESVAQVAALGVPPIASGPYEVVAEGRVDEDKKTEAEDVMEEIVAGVEAMSVGSEEDEDEVIEGKIVVRLPGDRKRRMVEAGEGEGIEEVEERTLVRAILVGPRSGVQGLGVGGRVLSGPSNSHYWTSKRGGMGRG